MNKPLVFSDRHHNTLFHSLKMLFEDRLGGTLFNPTGKEWFEKGIWKMAEIYLNSPFTINQYLGIQGEPDSKGIYHYWDTEYDYFQNAITYDKFMSLPIDIVIASVPEHIQSFGVLCENHPNHPKLIYQVGNHWTIEEGKADNMLASAIIQNVPPETNIVTYHQEFDLNTFRFEEPQPNRKIYSFINCYATAEHYINDWMAFCDLEGMMPGWEFRSFGGSCRDGAISGSQHLANKMREANFIYHVKVYGDGYGHILHNAFAVGRPLITRIADYKGRLAEPLLEDGETCFDVDKYTTEELADKITNIYPELYQYMCQEMKRRFEKYVNFDKEEKDIRLMLDKLK